MKEILDIGYGILDRISWVLGHETRDSGPGPAGERKSEVVVLFVSPEPIAQRPEPPLAQL